MQTCAALTELNLSNSLITDVGANALAKSLSANRTLQVLNLENNRFGDESACSLAMATVSSALKVLNLNGCYKPPGLAPFIHYEYIGSVNTARALVAALNVRDFLPGFFVLTFAYRCVFDSNFHLVLAPLPGRMFDWTSSSRQFV
jgi:hypothetical protein